MRKIKVLHFIGHGQIGGKERALFQLFAALRNDENIETGVAIGREKGPYIEKIKKLGIPLIFLNLKSGLSLNFKRDVVNRIKEFDIHHFHDPSPNYIFYSILAGKKIRRIFTRRGGDFSFRRPTLKKKLKFFLNKRLMLGFNGFTGNSIAAADSMAAKYGIDRCKVTVIHNGVNFGELNPNRDREAVQAELGLQRGDFLVGTACRLVFWKRIDLLLKAFSELSIPGKKLLILGDGADESKLVRLASSLGIQDSTIFRGAVSHVPDYLQLLDCFVLPSNPAESFGNAVVEAMYWRIPSVIMEDSGGIREHIEDGVTGFVARDGRELAVKIESIFVDRKKAKEIGSRASAFVQARYSMTRMVQSYREYYLKVIQ